MKSYKLYIYPADDNRKVKFVASQSAASAARFHGEARLATREELEAAVAELAYVPLTDRTGRTRSTRPAGAGDFVGAARAVSP